MKRSAVVVSLLAPSMLSGCAVLTPAVLAPLGQRPRPAPVTSAAGAEPAPPSTAPTSPETTAPVPSDSPQSAPDSATGPVPLGENYGSRTENGITRPPHLTFVAGHGWKLDAVRQAGQTRWSNDDLMCAVITADLAGNVAGTDAAASPTKARTIAADFVHQPDDTTHLLPPVTVARPHHRPVEFAAATVEETFKGKPLTHTVLARAIAHDDLTLTAVLSCAGGDDTTHRRITQVAAGLRILDGATH